MSKARKTCILTKEVPPIRGLQDPALAIRGAAPTRLTWRDHDWIRRALDLREATDLGTDDFREMDAAESVLPTSHIDLGNEHSDA